MVKFYDVDETYIDYLKTFDDKIPNIRYISNNKFVTGILLNIDDFEYYAPVSSFNIKQRTNFIIKDHDNTAISSVRFSFMFPVPAQIKNKVLVLKNFSNETEQNRNFLRKELNYINRHINDVKRIASNVYKRRIQGQQLYTMNCCDFKLLEEKCKLYIPEFYIYQDREQSKLVVFTEEKKEDRYNLYGIAEIPKDLIGNIRNLRQLSDKTIFSLIDENNKNLAFYSTVSKKVYETIDKLNEEVQILQQ